MHVLGQKKAVRQNLGNTTLFTFLPDSYTSTRREWLAVQLKLGLPCLRYLGRGCHAHPNLSLWLLYDNAPRWLGGNLGYNISRTDRSMLGNTLPFLGLSGLGRRGGGRRLTLALRWLLLRGLPCTGHKAINGHGLLGHHVSTTIRFSIRKVSNINSYLLGYLRGSLGFDGLFWLGGFLLDKSLFLNKCVSKFLEMSGHAFYRLVP